MNAQPNNGKCCGTTFAVLGIAGSFLVIGWMVWMMRSYTAPQSLFQVRGEERLKIKHAFDEANAPLIDSYDWTDKAKGFIRVPVDQAKELILQEWQDPQQGRILLTNRAAKLYAPVAPPKNQNE